MQAAKPAAPSRLPPRIDISSAELAGLVPPPAARLLAWYDRHRRTLPWRATPGETPDPYRVWLSEIMLQQTTVTAVIPYFERFLRRFPTVGALAAAPLDEVLGAWAGLGYYARARNLHACAQAVEARGGFPADLDGLRALPGIGPYTAAAIAAIAFGQPVVPVDGNVERVTARLFATAAPLPASRPLLARQAALLNRDPQARGRPSDFAQALFDLGAGLCTPRAPACALCPWMAGCRGRREGLAETLPARAAKAVRPQRHGAHFLARDKEGRVLLQRRPARGLLGGMLELPGTPWRTERWDEASALALAPFAADWRRLGRVDHVFTHFALALEIYQAAPGKVPDEALDGRSLLPPGRLAGEALPSLMRKCLALGGHGI